MMNSVRKLNTSGVTRALLYVLIFFQPFNHFNSFREISFHGLFILFVIKLVKGEVKNIAFNDKTIIALSLLAGWSFIVSISGPFPLDSLNAIRNNLLPEVIIFLIIIAEFGSIRELKPLLWVVVSSFAAVTSASIIECAVKDWDSLSGLIPSTSWRSTSTYFFANYSDNATFYLPLITGWLLSIKEVAWKKLIGTITLIIGVVLVYIYDARTQLLAVAFSFFMILFLTRKFKSATILLIALGLSFSLMISSDHERLSRYKSLASLDTYTTDEGLTNRIGLWQVVIEFIEERPLTGYGYGWKKLSWLVQEKDSAEFWKERPESAYNYYVKDAQLKYGRVNPHNLLLQITFEIGIIGVAIFIWLWGTILGKIFRTVKYGNRPEWRGFMLGCTGVILSYIVINLTNGFWQESYGMMIFLFMAVITVIHRELDPGRPQDNQS